MIFGAVFLVFGQSVTFDFVDWDDNLNVYENPYLLRLDWAGLARLWQAPYASLYVPLVYTTFFVEVLVSDWLVRIFSGLLSVEPVAMQATLRVASFLIHLDNLLLHIGASLCVYRICRRFLLGAAIPALAGALIFAMHPIQTEAVVWATGRKDLLCWTLCFWALDCFHEAARGFHLKRNLVIAMLAFLGALLAKPVAVVVPAMATVIYLAEIPRNRRLLVPLVLSFLIAGIAYFALRGPQSDLNEPVFQIEWWKRPFLVADNLRFYLTKLLFPVGLIPIYPRRLGDVLTTSLPWFSLPVCLLVVGVMLRSRLLAVAAALVLIPFAPASGAVPIMYHYFAVVADRYFYGSMLGIALLVSLGTAVLLRTTFHWPAQLRPWIARGIAIILLLFGGASFVQARHWRDSESLWRHELRWHPACVHALYNLASRRATSGALDEAVQLYERILVVDPYYAAAYTNLILLLDQARRPNEARDFALAALELPPNSAENFMARGHAFLHLNRFREAVESFQAAIHGIPEDAPAHNSMGMAYLGLGDEQAAEQAFRRAIELHPLLVPAHLNLGKIYLKRGELREASKHFRAALTGDPRNAEAAMLLREVEKRLGGTRLKPTSP